MHQFLSPNDNKLHGIAKNKWRAMRPNFQDDVRSSLLLMKCLDDVAADTIRGFFTKNLFLRPGAVCPRDVATVMRHGLAHSKIAARWRNIAISCWAFQCPLTVN